MPYTFPIKVEFDVAEPRIDAGRLVAAVDGTTWDLNVSDSDAFICPVTGTLMCRPLPYTTAWQNTYTGLYQRYRKEHFIGSDLDRNLDKVKEAQVRAIGDYWLLNQLVGAYPVYLKEALPRNQAMHMSIFFSGMSATDGIFICEFGWNRGLPNELAFKLTTAGDLEIIKGGTRVASFSRKEDIREFRYGREKNESFKSMFVSFTIIPYRKREVLILTDKGQAFNHAFDDLDAEATGQTIFPEGNFYYDVPIGRGMVQLAPVYFAPSCIAYSEPIEFRYAPGSAEFATLNYLAYWDQVGRVNPGGAGNVNFTWSLVDANSLSAFSANGSNRNVRVKMNLTASSDQLTSPGIYMAEIYNDPTTVNTGGSAIDVTTAIESMRMSVDENGRSTIQISARKGALETLGVNRPHIIGNRTFRVALVGASGQSDLIRGTLNAPSITYLAGDNTSEFDNALLTFQGMDRMATLDHAIVNGPAYDGFVPGDAILDLLEQAGFGAASTSISNFGAGFRFPYHPKISIGEYSLLPERGDTVGKWLDRIRSDFAATWQMGWVPTSGGYAFLFADTSAQSTSPVATLWMKTSDSSTNWSGNQVAASSRIVRGFDEHYEMPEANQVIVVGKDPMTRLLIYGNYNDALSQEPTLSPSVRPKNWLGEVRTVYYSDPSLTTQEMVGKSGLILAQRLMPGRTLAKWECDLLVTFDTERPLWIGDVVRIMESDGITLKGDYRILAVPTIEFIREDTTNNVFIRKASYMGWKINEQNLDFSNESNSGLWFI